MSEDVRQRFPASLRLAVAVPDGAAAGCEWPEAAWRRAFAAWLWPAARWRASIRAEAARQTRRPVARALSGGVVEKMTPPQPDEDHSKALVGRAVAGDPKSLSALFEIHREDLRMLCTRMLDDAASVDDAISEIFLRVHRALPQYDAARPFKPWLRTLASNHCIDQLRRRKTERGLFESADLAPPDASADDAPGALLQITQRELQRDVLSALDALPEKYRLPLVLRFYRDLDYDSIAETLGVTRNQVGTLLFRAKQRLRSELLERSGEQHPTNSSEAGR